MILTSYQQEHASLVQGGPEFHAQCTDRQTHIHYSFSKKESEAQRNEINAERQLCCARVGKGTQGHARACV